MDFTRYESRPITRLAHRITEKDVIVNTEEPNTYGIMSDGESITFKAYQSIQTGDFVVYLHDEDVYHCSQEVFCERNIVPEDEANQEETA